MSTTILHRRTRIVTLDPGEEVAALCQPDDIAIRPDANGWSVWFVGDDGTLDGYDEPYPSQKEALWAAKAAAEYASSGD
ncbi:hypothetical protein [Pseudoduganella chitinolytica]|uniref:Uncharacterized protein n=1 Tax=Pseudoduganella chitinolytica TaxID=34070 RepID=A0ABY8BG03_9BURK|nr:hypothetical protein [Pseudoduganella chitinolytica]WEF34750.1 hypothetical protein PX653_08300 [Pseudoduganella chitinolytica]